MSNTTAGTVPTLDKIKSAYFVGIKGVGMTALAQVFRARGIKVSGSDTYEKFFTDEVLKKLKIPVHEGFRKSNLPKKVDLVVASAAYLDKLKVKRQKLKVGYKNSEVNEVIRKGMPIFTYPEALRLIFKEHYGIAVAGTHGKSTVTAMLGVILEEAGLDPTVIVGTRVNQWESNALTHKLKVKSQKLKVGNKKPILVAEADEYREAFLNYKPKGLIITSIEYDHPDYFKTFRAYKNAFVKLIKKVPKDGFIVANWDDKNVRDVVVGAKCKIIEYGLHRKARAVQRAIVRTMARCIFAPGEHNISNALAAANASIVLRVQPSMIKKALINFRGTARRFELLRSSAKPTRNKRIAKLTRNCIVIDDYAHHPSEIKATLKTARDLWPKKKIWAMFQPHTFSRTAALLNDFAKSFQDADRVFILETYSSAREKQGKIGAKELACEIARYHQNVEYFSSIFSTIGMLRKELKNYSLATNHYPLVIITMGAGNIWQVAKSLTKIL